MSANRKKTWRRIGILVLMLGSGLAAPVYGFVGGTGEPNNPYQIATAADLLSIGSDPDLLKKSFVLLNDIDLDPTHVFESALIAPDRSEGANGHGGNPFTGVLDGQGHAIRNLRVSCKSGYDAGLFGMLSGLVKDLRLEGVQVSGSPGGALAGDSKGMILRCSVSGQVIGSDTTGGLVGGSLGGMLVQCTVLGTVKGGERVGGLMGEAWNVAVLNCESEADVSGSSAVGGLVGHTLDGARLVDCRATGTVTGGNTTGGLVGQALHATILRCTAACQVTGLDRVGGLIGDAWGASILNCEAQSTVQAGAYVGGLVGRAHTRTQIIESRAAGSVTAGKSAAGLVGSSQQTMILRSAAACPVVATGAAGGLTGDTTFGDVSIIDCYARGSVTGSLIGGLIGDAGSSGFPTNVLNSYAACEMLGMNDGTKPPIVGGLFGNRKFVPQSFVAAGCFWDTEVSKVSASIGSASTSYGTGLATKLMQQQNTFRQAGWDFGSTWVMPENDYPVLRWESAKNAKQP